MIGKPIAKMTVEELADRFSAHQSMARMYREHGYPDMAKEFQKLAKPYREEIERRQRESKTSEDPVQSAVRNP